MWSKLEIVSGKNGLPKLRLLRLSSHITSLLVLRINWQFKNNQFDLISNEVSVAAPTTKEFAVVGTENDVKN